MIRGESPPTVLTVVRKMAWNRLAPPLRIASKKGIPFALAVNPKIFNLMIKIGCLSRYDIINMKHHEVKKNLFAGMDRGCFSWRLRFRNRKKGYERAGKDV